MTDRHAVVIGAGAVGIATALYLQRDDWRVTVVDPEAPAERTSAGNAGLIALNSVTPVAMPGTLLQVPKMLLDPDSALAIRWRYLPKLLPWLVRFVRASRPDRVQAISRALADILVNAFDAYMPLVKDAGATDLIRRRGLLVTYGSQRSLDAANAELDLKRRLGLNLETLGQPEMRQLVPALAPNIAHGVLFPDVGHTVDPQQLVKTLAEHFRQRGGAFVTEQAVGFETDENGVHAVRTESGGSVAADACVVAAGAWSKELAAALGSKVPLDTERGYHVTLAEPAVAPALPVISGDLRFAITPMAMGVRLAGTVEFGGLEAPPNPARHRLIMKHAKALLPGLNMDRPSYWMGFRPSMPDSLAVIGRTPRHRNAYLAFGHGHLGLTEAAVTGQAIAALAADRPPPFDVTPFRAERFGGGA